MINVLIADDDPLIRDALEIIIGKDERFTLCGIAENGKEAVELCRKFSVDVALLDIRMPEMDGLDAAGYIINETGARVLLLSTFAEETLARDAFQSGVSGYLLKGTSRNEICDSIALVASGHKIFRDEIFSSLESGNRMAPDISNLSKRETEIAGLIADGCSNREIADRIFLSEGTVKNHITSILSKLDLTQRTQIAVFLLSGKK